MTYILSCQNQRQELVHELRLLRWDMPFKNYYSNLFYKDADPVCDFEVSNISRELSNGPRAVLIAWCSVSFRGNWAPVMEWRTESETGPIMETGITNITIPDPNVTSVMTVGLNDTKDNVEYVATVKFSESMKPHSTTADNVPNYTFVWRCCRINRTREFQVSQIPNIYILCYYDVWFQWSNSCKDYTDACLIQMSFRNSNPFESHS